MHLARDLAAHLLLGRETVAASAGAVAADRAAACYSRPEPAPRGRRTHHGQRARDAIHEALQSALLAAQDVDLRLHQYRSACLIEQLRAGLG